MPEDLLFLCHRLPFPPNKGDKIRSHAILRHLSERFRVHVGCFIDDPRDRAHLDAVRALAGGECRFVDLTRATKAARAIGALASGAAITTACFGSGQLRRWVGELVTRKVSRAVVFGSAMAPYILAQPGIAAAKSVLDMVDIDSDKWRQYAAHAAWPTRWLYAREHRKLHEVERASARRFGATVFVTAYEADCFAQMAPQYTGRIHAIRNGVDLEYFSPSLDFPRPFVDGEEAIVMTGMMDYRPNIDAAEWFITNVLPLLAERCPGARFYAVGANPPPSLMKLAGRHVTVTGRVEDVRPYLRHASVVVAPLRIARGVPNKVLEAMAMARPVVGTSAVARSLEAEPGVDLWVEDEPERFAAAVIDAMLGSRRADVAECGRRYVARSHVWNRNLRQFDDLLAELGAPGIAPDRSVSVRAPVAGRSVAASFAGRTAQARG